MIAIRSITFTQLRYHLDSDIYWWCTERFGPNGGRWFRSNVRQRYEFENEKDFTMFLLRWL